MAWDSSGRYYYRSRWVAGRPVREYVGTGLVAEFQAAVDEDQATKRAQERIRLHAEQARLDPLDQQLSEVCGAAEVIAKLALLTAGYRQHARGHWRRRRSDD